MKQFCLILFFLAGNISLQAKDITGTIKNKQGEVLTDVSILLLQQKDSQLAKGDITNKEGEFKFEQPAEGNYVLFVNALGFQKYYSTPFSITANNEINTFTIVLEPSDKQIKEVRITAKKPMIEVKADKTVFNVEQSINAAGSNALDLLRKSPGVRVDKDENIEMRGKNNVLIYIDGKPTYLGNKDLANLLKNMQAADIETIELISNPSAKYDASGNAGIINIRLKKNKNFGTNGSLSAGLGYGVYLKEQASLSLNHRNKKLNVFGNYSFSKGKRFNAQKIDRIQNGMRYDFESENINDDQSHNIKAGADYYINSRSVIGVMASMNRSAGDFTSSSKTFISPVGGEVDKVLIAANTISGSRLNAGINGNYKYEDTSGRSFNLDLDYGNFHSRGSSSQPNTYWNKNETTVISQSVFKNSTPTLIDIYAAKADYEQNIGKGKLGIGLKSAYVKTDNDFKFFDVVNNADTLNLNRSNHFVYTENVNAAYVSYARSFKEKFSLQVGLRAEQTQSKGMLSSAFPQPDDTVSRKYIDFFPSGGFSYNLNAKNTFGVSYSRRIDRPNYQDLNPFENKLDELTYEKGNAFLRPQYTQSVSLTHTLMQAVTTSLSYSHVRDMFMQTTDTTEFSKTYVTQKNFASMDIAGIDISFPVPLRKWWMIYANINANYNELSADFEGRTLRNTYYTYTFYADNQITLPHDVSLNVTGWYTGPNYWGGTFRMKPMGSIDIGVQKLFFQKKLSMKLSLSDLLKSQSWYATSNFAGLYAKANGSFESRQLKLNLSYRFGNRQVTKQRDRESGASKEKGRIK